jgi:hypothetical protein
MILSACVGVLVLAILVMFFRRSVRMDMGSAVIAALVSGAILALIVFLAVSGGQFLG